MDHLWAKESNIERDWGWGVLAFKDADSITPQRFAVLKNKLIIPGLVCMSGGNIYVFHTSMNYWSVLCSSQSLVFINNIVGAESATVKYGDASEPYVPYIERECAERIARDIPQSICIGTERLRISLLPGGIGLSRCEPLLDYPADTKKILATLCYMPIHIRFWPKTWHKTSDFKMYKFISPFFVDPVEMKTLEWSLGHAMIDPHSYSKTVVLFGPGGRGKSTIVAAINSAFFGCCGSIPDSALENLSGGISTKVASTVASNRIVTAGDVGGTNRNTNLTVVKSLTGHDYLPIPPHRVRTACTLVYSTNTLDSPIDNPEWCTEAIMRRVVVILINPELMENFIDLVPSDPTSRLDFVLRCVHTRLANTHMPVSTMSILLTILGSRYADAVKFVTEVGDDEEVDDDEIVLANSIVGAMVNKTAEEIGALASRISKGAVVKIKGSLYIKGIVSMY